MFKNIIFLIYLIIEINSKKYILIKNSIEKYDFSPYTFDFTLNNQSIANQSIFDTTQTYILIQNNNENSNLSKNILLNNNDKEDKNITINGKIFKYKTTNKLIDKGYNGIIGLSNIDLSKMEVYSYLYMIEEEEKNIKRVISFVQTEEKQALMLFGDIDSRFNHSISRKCECSSIYWSCKISSIKVGENELYTPENREYGIFSISEEYIIAPKIPGVIIISEYKKIIEGSFGIVCNENENAVNKLVNLTCNYFNYEELPDLTFVMEDGFGIMAISIDLFKIIDNRLEFKIKYKNNSDDNSNNWYLGEPVVKNYNLLLDYTNESSVNLIIIPASLNGFILIIVACVGGFLFLFVFLTCIYCLSKKDKSDNNNNKKRKSYFSGWINRNKNSDNFFSAINSYNNYISEKIQENDDEDKNSEDEENEIINNNNDIEERKLDIDYENDNLVGGPINDSFFENTLISNNFKESDNLINTNKNNKDSFSGDKLNKSDINVELSINSFDENN